MEAVVEWAVEALAAGFDSRSLRILAGLEPPHDPEEIRRLYAAAFVEIGISPLSQEAHIRFFIASVLRGMLSGELGSKAALERLADLHIARGYDRELADFYRLYHAKWDLESQEVQWYWSGADRSNIEHLIETYAKRWLENHDHGKVS